MEWWSGGVLERWSLGTLAFGTSTPTLRCSITPWALNEKGEAVASPRRVILGRLAGCCRGGFGQDVDAVAVLVERDLPGLQGE